MMKRFFLLIALVTLSALSFAQSKLTQEEILNNVDTYVQQIMKDWKIPGMGVAIVKDNDVIFTKGYGIKEMGKDEKVDENTVFQIGSVSKSFTAAIIASLVDEGLLSWEDTVKNILPDFKMYDPWVSENLQVKDLTTHRTGLDGQIGTYIPNLGYDRDDIYQMLQRIKPSYSFRGDYRYNNITFIPAAKVIEKVTGKSWEENLQERIFDKLGMTQSTYNGEGFSKVSNVALPHEFYAKNGEMVVNPLYGEEQALWWLTVIGPAGSLCCPPVDLIKWAQFHLNNGKVGDTQVISEKSMKYLHKGTSISSQNENRIRLYGHCWWIEQSKKGQVIFHTGTTWGMTTICWYHPELKLGMTVQVNSEAPEDLRYALMRRVIDLYLGEADYDYNGEAVADWYKRAKERAESQAKAAAEKVFEKAPEADLLVGKYSKDPLFGDALVSLKEGKLYIKVGKQGWEHELKHVSGNTYNFRSDGAGFDVKFSFDGKNEKASSFEIDFGEGEDFGPWTRGSVVSLNEKKPIIGISGYVEGSANLGNNTYINSVRNAGGVPLVIPVTSDEDQIAAIIGAIDGLIMTGGEDFDPLKWYGEEPLRECGTIVPSRDEFDVKLVRAAVAAGIPVLGICRGHQLLSVAFGGSLYQDIPSQIPESYVKHRQSGTTSSYGTHSITIEKGSLLHKQFGVTTIAVNSFHHQSVKAAPKGFKVTATSADGIVEAMERTSKLKEYQDGGAVIMGVQFHPEAFAAKGSEPFLSIFRYLVNEAK